MVMSWIFTAMTAVSVIAAILLGNGAALSAAVLLSVPLTLILRALVGA